MRAPVVTDQVRLHATKLDAVSDEIDAVNVLKGSAAWDAASEFDKGKNKDDFRQYDDACDRVKAFYAVSLPSSQCLANAHEADKYRNNTPNRHSHTTSRFGKHTLLAPK
jgi:inositol oxygenase